VWIALAFPAWGVHLVSVLALVRSGVIDLHHGAGHWRRACRPYATSAGWGPAGGPPHLRPDDGEQRQDHHGAHQEGVQQDAQSDDDAQLGQHDRRQHASTQNTAARTTPALVMTAPVADTARTMPSRVPWVRASSRARHQEDGVVDAECDQEQEREQWRAVVQRREADQMHADPAAQAQRGQRQRAP
jgi:hypothetical protein